MQTRRASDRAAFAAVMRECFPLYIQKVFETVSPGSDYLHNWHIDAIAEHLLAVERGEIRRLVVNMPPRNLKSIAITVAWSTRLLGMDPSRQILAASYAEKLAIKHNLDVRLVCSRPWFREAFPSFRFAQDQNEKAKFQTTMRGHRIATSVGSSAIGEGGDFLIVDDPHNPTEAQSDTERERATTWFDQGFTTRLNDKRTGSIVLVMQRLHEKDLTGHVLEKGGWHHLKLEAEAEAHRVISIGNFRKVRKPGDILHPEREGPNELAQAKRDLGSYGYAGQYQQNPSPIEGGVIKLAWFRRFKFAPDPLAGAVQYVLSIDTAQKESELNDWTVCGAWAIEGVRWHLVNVWRERVDSVDLLKMARAQFLKWRPVAVLVEDKGSGIGLIQQLKRGARVDELDPNEKREAVLSVPVVAIDPGTRDKTVRAMNAAPMIEAGHVWLPESAPWLHDFESELRNFPNVAHDDQTDMLTQFVAWASLWQGGGGDAKSSGTKKSTAAGAQAERTNTGWGTSKVGGRFKGF